MGFMGYVFKALGFESDEQKIKPKKAKASKTKAAYNFKNGKSTSRVDHIDGIPVYYPVSFEQAREYAYFLKDKKALILSTDSCEKGEAERILDYFHGVTFGINAKFIVLDEDRLYLLLPEGLEVEE